MVALLERSFYKNVRKAHPTIEKVFYCVASRNLLVKNQFDYHKSIVPYVIYFLFKTGMRFSELIALTWDDVDEVGEQVKTYRRYNTAIHKFTPPKNNTSIRLVSITSDMLSLLKTLRRLQLRTNKELNIDNKNNLIF